MWSSPHSRHLVCPQQSPISKVTGTAYSGLSPAEQQPCLCQRDTYFYPTVPDFLLERPRRLGGWRECELHRKLSTGGGEGAVIASMSEKHLDYADY